jgi:hypothetical protein
MNLTDYYEQLPGAVAPKTEFVGRVAKRCQVNEATVRLWVKGKSKPCNLEWLDILAEETGLNKENLFEK